jgi:outer membrane protein OmpA-like peptidoglycan-associated protein
MRNKIIILAALAVAAGPAFAGKSSRTNKAETAGVSSGMALGAIVGGPVGAVIGAAVGGWTGDKFHREQTARLQSEERYDRAQAKVDSLEDLVQGSERRISELQSALRREELGYREALQEALNTQVFFHTGEAELDDSSRETLTRIAGLMKSIDGFVIDLSGHADSRGDENYNAQLSEDRANSVRDALVSAGFPVERIRVYAEGETFSRADEDDLDALALERRVHIEVVGDDRPPRVARQ